ncbi:unnamed protein product [Rotaria sordida]|uniref:Uncharacterized protein n=2 Tax=Rotaria sordida TaxID=392033 RepID=A0A815EUD1_9BILA|nr:unnamed protein product [Rotaria sordida]
MNTPIQGTNQTRWDELKSLVNIVVDICSVMDSNGIDIYFLNRDPMLNVTDARYVRQVFNAPPQGLTPLVPALRRVLAAKRNQPYEKKLLILIATDGAPTNEYGQLDVGALEAVLRHERTPQTYVTFLACTDDLQTVSYLSNWDRVIPNLDVMDDYRSERAEIQRTRGGNFPFSFGDYIVKSLLGSIDPWRRTVIFTIAIISLLVVFGVIFGLIYGLKTPFPDTNGKTCGASHETYIINGTSILGKYSRAAIAVDNVECSKIGRQILEKNGTTMDAALAAAICNGVMSAHSMGIGGGCTILIYSKKKNKAYSLIGRERAPLAANATMFIGRENMSMTGGLAIAVPGELRAYKKAYDEFGGGVSWRDLFQPTIELCRNGFIISSSQAAAIKETKSYILKDPIMRELFIKNNQTNELYSAGDIMKRPKYARTLEIIAEQGVDAFYTGILADKIVKEIHDRGGIITKQDLADYQIDFNEALHVNLNDSLTAFTSQAPSSGPILIFILNILRGYNIFERDLKKISTSALFYHRLIEAFKFAYAKRSELGDPLQINIASLIRDLTSKDYANRIRARIDDHKTFSFEYYGGTWLDKIKTGTSHLSVIGPDGDAVALTSTVNLYYGSKVLGSETGIIYNDEMDDFSTPNTTNYFGIPPSPANFIAPGKRPVSSMSPLILLENSHQRVQQVIGASGGTKITTSVAQVAMLNLWFNENIKEATDAPRLHSQLLPQQVIVEQGFDYNILNHLKQRGHNITCSAYGGSVIQGIEWRDEVNQYWANCDIRKGGAPDGIS